MEQLSTYFRICLGISLLFLLASCEGGEESPFEQRWPVQGGVGGQWGYIDESGNIAIPQQFDYATEFSEGFGGVNIGGTRYRNHFPTDGKWGFVDSYGRFLINPVYDSPPTYAKPYDLRDLSMSMHEGYIFSEGLAPVYKEGRWFYIGFLADKLKDTLYIASAWKKEEDNSIKTYPIRSARRFKEGLAAVYIDGSWGYINYWGEIIIEPQFVYPVEFSQGRILAMGKDLRQVIYNTKGERELPMYRIVSEFKDGLAVVKPKMLGQSIQDDDEIKYALIDTSGKFMFTAQFDKIGDFGSGLAPVLVGSNPDTLKYNPDKQIIGNRGPKWGFIDMFGHFVHNPVFQDAKGFVEGVAAVKRGEYWGYMEPDGSMLTEYEFLWAGNFKNGMAQVRLGPTHNDYAGLYAFMNLDGDIIYIQEN